MKRVGGHAVVASENQKTMNGNTVATFILQLERHRASAEALRRFEDVEAKPRLVAMTSLGAIVLLLSLGFACNAIAGGSGAQVCDVRADYLLGAEDYSEAIRLHAEVVRMRPDNALAHYHLGFAEGMVGNRTEEVREYRRAAVLGLRIWDLFLNLGLAQLEGGDLDAAMASLKRAVLLGEDHPESHFNLALVDEQLGMLADAEHEILASLRLNPCQPDGRNLLGVIYAQQGKTARAAQVWRELLREIPEYKPARTNLVLLSSQSQVALGGTTGVTRILVSAVGAVDDDRKPFSRALEAEPTPASTQRVEGE
jgi:Flp pilus assembly protein TadD